METKSKMAAKAAMLDERRRWSLKETFLQSVIEINFPPVTPMSHKKIGPVDPGVGQKINGNQIQDGHRSSHLG
jgi:hypothetical protein